MKQASVPNNHAAHDELLIARLYGNDVDERERTRALEQMAACQECAGLFADFGAIASETVALPTPARPRDFPLPEADAARVGRPLPARRRLPSFSLRPVRAFGGALMAVGFAGMIFSAALGGTFASRSSAVPAPDLANKGGEGAAVATSIGGSRAPTFASAGASAGATAYYDVGLNGCGSGAGAVDSSGEVISGPATCLAPSAIPEGPSGSSAPAPSAAPSGEAALAGGTATPGNKSYIASPKPTYESHTNGQGTTGGSSAGNAASGNEAQAVAIGSFAALVLIGLVLLLVGPRLRSRRQLR